ncbi:28S ribosomal protein S22 like protein [Argiope bruennichi]|uniref:28S ribosomal protein S22 like protein n=1 Tax=Argiope bruennichi TaxID=94029 RepID=A0A8T0F0E3_ARGBR|nr:28S ribosomal protein S22 like protein [Argiope bruennichi]
MNSFLKKYSGYSRNFYALLKNYSTQSLHPMQKKLETLFINKDVQKILKKITGLDHEKIFAPSKTELESPKYEFRLLDEGSYEFVLDCACIQFEPDAPEYHRVTNQTYEHVQLTKKFDLLRSTRHFGPMVFYFTHKKNIDQLLIDMISRHLISDASDTVRLFYLIHSELDTTKDIHKTDEIEILQNYIRNHSSQKDGLEFALQTILDHKKSDLQI